MLKKKQFSEKQRFGNPNSSGSVTGTPGGIGDSIIRVPEVNSGVTFLGSEFGVVEDLGG